MAVVSVNPGPIRPRETSTLENIAMGVDVAAKILGTGIDAYKTFGLERPETQARTKLLEAQAADTPGDKRLDRDLKRAQIQYYGAQKAADIESKKATTAKTMRELEKPNLSEGEIALDKEFAKEIADYRLAGGFASTEKNINQAEEAAKDIASGKVATGGWAGWLPRFGKEAFAEALADTEDKVLQAVGSSLRQTLGAQFTEKEGARILGWAFNPRLSNDINAKRVQRIVTQLRAANAAKNEAANYFKTHKTMSGYEGMSPDAAFGNFYNDETYGLKSPNTTAAPTKPKTVIQNGHTYILNEQTGEYE